MRRLAAACAALALAAPCAGQIADGQVHGTGYVEAYTQALQDRGHGAGPLAGRFYDTRHDGLDLALADAGVYLVPDGRHRIGFNAELMAGEAARTIHATEPGGANAWSWVSNLYASARLDSRRALQLDAGVFQTWIGSEGLAAYRDDQYSRSLLYALAEPTYHAGFRLTLPLSARVTGGLYFVNGWNEIRDANSGKSAGFSISDDAGHGLSLSLNGIAGDEGAASPNDAGSYGGIGFAAPGVRTTGLIDAIAAWQATGAWRFALNADAATTLSGAAKPWRGIAAYATWQPAKRFTLALRGELFDDAGGLRTGSSNRLSEVTATADWLVARNARIRLEARHDGAAHPYFDAGGTASAHQETLTLAGMAWF